MTVTPLCGLIARVASTRAVLLSLAAAGSLASLAKAEPGPARFVVDGADITLFTGMSASLRFRLQNNTPIEAQFQWSIGDVTGATPLAVSVPARSDVLISTISPMLTTPGLRRYDLLLREIGSGEALRASLDAEVIDPMFVPAVRTNEDDVVVSDMIQKPVTIVLPVDPGAVRDGPVGSARSVVTVACFAVASNPDARSAGRLFDVSPAQWTVAAQPGRPIETAVTIAVPAAGLPCGTMNTIAIYVVAWGDTVMASGQAIYRDDCWKPTVSPADEGGESGAPAGEGGAAPLIAIRAIEPNPAPASVTLRFELAQPAAVRAVINDAQGRVVRELSLGALSAGPNMMVWDGNGNDGAEISSGTYWIRLESASSRAVRRVVLIRR